MNPRAYNWQHLYMLLSPHFLTLTVYQSFVLGLPLLFNASIVHPVDHPVPCDEHGACFQSLLSQQGCSDSPYVCVYIYHFAHTARYLQDRFLEMELLGERVCAFIILIDVNKLAFVRLFSSLWSHQHHTEMPVSLLPSLIQSHQTSQFQFILQIKTMPQCCFRNDVWRIFSYVEFLFTSPYL